MEYYHRLKITIPKKDEIPNDWGFSCIISDDWFWSFRIAFEKTVITILWTINNQEFDIWKKKVKNIRPPNTTKPVENWRTIKVSDWVFVNIYKTPNGYYPYVMYLKIKV